MSSRLSSPCLPISTCKKFRGTSGPTPNTIASSSQKKWFNVLTISSGKETSDRTKKGATKSRVVPCTPNLPGNPTTHNRPLRYIFSVVASQIIRIDIHTLEVRDFLRQYSQQLRTHWQNDDRIWTVTVRLFSPVFSDGHRLKKIQDHTETMKGK